MATAGVVGHDRLPRRTARAGEAAPRPYNVDNPSPIGDRGISVMRDPRHVGVRRCLTRPARRAGNDTADARRRSVAIIAACRSATWMCRAPGAGGRGGASPRQGGATHPRSGGRVRRVGPSRPSGRGQAVPDPSGPRGPV